MTMPSETDMRTAVATRDKAFDGKFFYGVITTGIFCQPSCASRAAKTENQRFFQSIDAAEIAGFRPCKRCRPTDGNPQMDRLVEIARHIEKHADEKLTLTNLAAMAGLSSSRFQRIFKQSFGVSPKAYQDNIRMQRFKKSLKKGEGVTDAILASGYGSISRVYGEASRNIGMTPKAYRAGGVDETITYACRKTALGIILMAATDKGVCFVQFGESEAWLMTQLKAEFPKAKLKTSLAEKSHQLDAWINALDNHLSEGAPSPDLPIDMRGSAFQIKVWRFLLSIKEGEVVSYAEVAKGINKPKAFRAVATACASNRIGVLIPCHRVLRGDGGLGGFRWGLERKRTLLAIEKQRLARSKNS